MGYYPAPGGYTGPPTYIPQIYNNQSYPGNYNAMQMQQQPTAQSSGQGGFLCRPVTSRAEAEVAQIALDGSTAWFYDTSADRMYAKTFNPLDGRAPITAYVREAPAPPVQYATAEELNALREEIAQIKIQQAASRKQVKNDKSDE